MTLLIWEEVPERIRFYALETYTLEENNVLKAAHGHYLNIENTPTVEDALNKINAALSSTSDGYKSEDPAFWWVGKWAGKELVAAALPTSGPFHTVFSCGFVL